MMQRITEWILRHAPGFYHCFIGDVRRASQAAAAKKVAAEIGAPAEQVTAIMFRTADGLDQLAEDVEFFPVIDRAVTEIRALSPQPRPVADDALPDCINRMPDLDYKILCQWRERRSADHIAASLEIDPSLVRKSLEQTYFYLRLNSVNAETAVALIRRPLLHRMPMP